MSLSILVVPNALSDNSNFKSVLVSDGLHLITEFKFGCCMIRIRESLNQGVEQSSRIIMKRLSCFLLHHDFLCLLDRKRKFLSEQADDLNGAEACAFSSL